MLRQGTLAGPVTAESARAGGEAAPACAKAGGHRRGFSATAGARRCPRLHTQQPREVCVSDAKLPSARAAVRRSPGRSTWRLGRCSCRERPRRWTSCRWRAWPIRLCLSRSWMEDAACAWEDADDSLRVSVWITKTNWRRGNVDRGICVENLGAQEGRVDCTIKACALRTLRLGSDIVRMSIPARQFRAQGWEFIGHTSFADGRSRAGVNCWVRKRVLAEPHSPVCPWSCPQCSASRVPGGRRWGREPPPYRGPARGWLRGGDNLELGRVCDAADGAVLRDGYHLCPPC